MKKMIAILLSLMMIISFASCRSDNKESGKDASKEETTAPADNSSSEDVKKDVAPADVEKAVAEALGDGYLATVEVPEDEIELSALGALDLEKIESYIVKQSTVPSVNIDSVVVVKCKEGYADEAVEGLNSVFENKMNYIRQYPFGVAKAEGARLYKVDDLVMFILAGASADESMDAEAEAKLAKDEYEKVDNAIKGLFGSVPENLAIIPEESEHHGGLIGG